MIALTTIGPNRIEHQQKCVYTWRMWGIHIISFNTQNEIDTLKHFFPEVEFIATDNTLEEIYKRPYICLSVFLNFIKNSNENCFIINSDIEIHSLPIEIESTMQKGIIICNRYNYIAGQNFNDSSEHDNGFDAFFISQEHAKLYPENDFAIGQCHYDYWIPFVAIKKQVPVYRLKKRCFLHLNHPTGNQYQDKNWHKTMAHFIDLEGLNFLKNERSLWAANDYVFKILQNNVNDYTPQPQQA